jgi:hypothetical protein
MTNNLIPFPTSAEPPQVIDSKLFSDGDNVIMEFAGEVADLLDESRVAQLATEVRR